MQAAKALILVLCCLVALLLRGTLANYCYSDRLLAYYPVESGSTLVDRSAYKQQLDLTVMGQASIVTSGSSAPYLRLTGASGSRALLQNFSHTNKIREAVYSSGQLTIEVWLEATSTSVSSPGVVLAHSRDAACTSSNMLNFEIRQVGSSYVPVFKHSLASNACNTLPAIVSAPVRSGKRQLVFTYDSNRVSMYTDGVLDSTATIVSSGSVADTYDWSSNLPISVGATAEGASAWAGKVYSVAMWNKKLEQEQIAELFSKAGAYRSTCRMIESFISCVYRQGNSNNMCAVLWGYTSLSSRPETIAAGSASNKITTTGNSASSYASVLPRISTFLPGTHLHAWRMENVACSLFTSNPNAANSIAWRVNGTDTNDSTSSYHTGGSIQDNAADCAVGYAASCATQTDTDASYVSETVSVNMNGVPGITPLYLAPANDPVRYYGYDPQVTSTTSGIEQQFASVLRRSIWITAMHYDTAVPVSGKRMSRAGELYYRISYDIPSNGLGGRACMSLKAKRPSGFQYGTRASLRKSGYTNPFVVQDDPVDIWERWMWNSDTLEGSTQNMWGTTVADGMIIGPITDCITLRFSTCSGSQNYPDLSTARVKFVTYNSTLQTRVVIDSGVKAIDSGELTLCPSCTLTASDPYGNSGNGGAFPCATYDMCGVCNGDNTTCSWTGDGCDNPSDEGCLPANVDVLFNSTCSAYAYSDQGEPSIMLTAQGLFIPNLTTTYAALNCDKPGSDSIEAILNGSWVITETNTSMTDSSDRRIMLRSFSQAVRLSVLQQCFTTLNGVIRGSTTVQSKSNGRLVHSSPCAFAVSVECNDVITSSYTSISACVEARTIYQMWFSDQTSPGTEQFPSQSLGPYTDMLNVIETSIPKVGGSETRLVNATISGTPSATMPGITLLAGSACSTTHTDAATHCVQTWSVATANGSAMPAFTGDAVMMFDIDLEQPDSPFGRPFPNDGRWYLAGQPYASSSSPKATVNIHLQGARRPSALSNINLDSYRLAVQFYRDQQLTVPSTRFFNAQRIHALVKVSNVRECDSVALTIKSVKVCVSRITGEIAADCDSQSVISETVIDLHDPNNPYYGGARWAAAQAPVPGREQCGSMLALSWTSRILCRQRPSAPVTVQITWAYNHHSGTLVMPPGGNTQQNMFKTTRWSLESMNFGDGGRASQVYRSSTVRPSVRMLNAPGAKRRLAPEYHPSCHNCDGSHMTDVYHIETGCPDDTEYDEASQMCIEHHDHHDHDLSQIWFWRVVRLLCFLVVLLLTLTLTSLVPAMLLTRFINIGSYKKVTRPKKEPRRHSSLAPILGANNSRLVVDYEYRT
jgi:hypothetical protein